MLLGEATLRALKQAGCPWAKPRAGMTIEFTVISASRRGPSRGAHPPSP